MLGTGLSHDGSTCILKDGKIAIAIEKERITRRKHDGGNDRKTVQYCLDALGISTGDLALVVQAANFEKDIAPGLYQGIRCFTEGMPVVTISHHLAHAWSAIATSPFTQSNVLVIDGSGSPVQQCDDWPDEPTRAYWHNQKGFWCEKDSFYHYNGHEMQCLHKDFSGIQPGQKPASALRMPVTYSSIGGLYAAGSNYCFGNMDDAGKLMGLAPYGRSTYCDREIYCLENGKAHINHNVFHDLDQPSSGYEHFKQNFQHYADIARWIQRETERAVVYTAQSRIALHPHDNLCYAGGVALNAVCNALLLRNGIVRQLYMQPAAGDNGLAIGCAFYGWRQILKKEIPKTGNTTVFFGKSYEAGSTEQLFENHELQNAFSWKYSDTVVDETAALLAAGKVVAWFRGGAEFGPRALGHRSILADPRRKDVQAHINKNIKFREDFRPFAPAVPEEDVAVYFKNGRKSPYMILVDEIKDGWREAVPGIVHVDGTCRVQTVDASWNPEFHALLHAFGSRTGIPMLVNTSFNRRGMPIVETPREALDFFLSCALDVLVIDDYIISKKNGNTMIRYLQLPFRFDAARMQDEVNAITAAWTAHFNKMHYQGDWSGLPLRSPGGQMDNLLADASAVKQPFRDTALLEQCPYLRSVLDSMPWEKTSARLLKLAQGAVVKEHRDLGLNYEQGEVRLHIPVITHADVEFYLDGHRLEMKEGECWYINANLPHKLANPSPADRIHLVVDCLVNGELQAMFERNDLPVKSIKDMSGILRAEQQIIIEEMKRSGDPVRLRLAAEMEAQLHRQ